MNLVAPEDPELSAPQNALIIVAVSGSLYSPYAGHLQEKVLVGVSLLGHVQHPCPFVTPHCDTCDKVAKGRATL